MLVGAGAAGDQWNDFGVIFGLASAVGIVGAGIRSDEFILTVVGLIGTFVYLPATLGTFFGETIGAPAVMLISGLAVLAVAMELLRRPGGPGSPHARLTTGGARPRRAGPRRPGVSEFVTRLSDG